MKTVFIALSLLATICAYHINYHVVIDYVEYKNIPEKFNKLNQKIILPDETIEILKNITKNIQEPRAGTEAIVNDYADEIFTNLKGFMIQQGLDPFQLPDQHSGFSYTLIITYHGELDLTSGWLTDISTIHRNGDVLVSYSSNTKYLTVTVPIAFNDLQYSYDYSAKIMGLGPTGGVSGKIKDIEVKVTIGFDTQSFKASLDSFDITHTGHINVDFSGHALVDWLFNLLSDVVTALLKPLILLIVEDIVKGGLNDAVNAINDAIGSILNPTTVAPSVAEAIFYFN